jgi:hypothetical protein
MRKHIAITLVFTLVGVLFSGSSASAVVLAGFPLYVYQGLIAGASNVYIFTAGGAFCGMAMIPGVGPAGMPTVAFETAREALLGPPPINFGVWWVAPLGDPGVCTGVAGALGMYYVAF